MWWGPSHGRQFFVDFSKVFLIFMSNCPAQPACNIESFPWAKQSSQTTWCESFQFMGCHFFKGGLFQFGSKGSLSLPSFSLFEFLTRLQLSSIHVLQHELLFLTAASGPHASPHALHELQGNSLLHCSPNHALQKNLSSNARSTSFSPSLLSPT